MKRILLSGIAALSFLPATLAARPVTPDDLVNLRRVSAPAVSPDGRLIAYQLRETDLAANKGRNDIWLIDRVRRIAPRKIAGVADKNETEPQFSADGTAIYYLSDQSGTSQVWRVGVSGSGATQVTSFETDVSGFLLSPQNDKMLVWADTSLSCEKPVCPVTASSATTSSARTYDKLFVRHWDSWSDPGKRSRLFVLSRSAAGSFDTPSAALVGKLEGDTPSKPMGGGDELAWSADGKTVYFALREAGRIESLSTNLDIFAAPADGSGAPVNLTDANDAMDTSPAVSPDGKWLAYAAMKRPGYESDRLVVMLRDIATGATRALTENWDRSAESIKWAPDSKSLLVTTHDHFDAPIFRVDLAGGTPARLTGAGAVSAVVPVGKDVIYAMDSLTAPADLYALDSKGKTARLTSVNADKLAGIEMPVAEKFSFAGANGDTVWAYALKPSGLATGAKAPVAFLVHGGPQGSFGNAWSYRWNPAVFAGAGYATILVDFHGSTGYGQAFTDSINKDWGGKPLEDLKRGLAAAGAKYAWADTANACAAGGSYGGYMMNWIAGKWPDGFKCLVSHAGVFDARGMAYSTEELWFDEWEHGGPYFEHPEEYEKWNPVNHVSAWKAPILVIHGEKDFRIPYVQGLSAFTAAQRRGVPSRLVMFPDENHWILKPKNSLAWYSEVLGWMDKWTKGAGEGASSR